LASPLHLLSIPQGASNTPKSLSNHLRPSHGSYTGLLGLIHLQQVIEQKLEPAHGSLLLCPRPSGSQSPFGYVDAEGHILRVFADGTLTFHHELPAWAQSLAWPSELGNAAPKDGGLGQKQALVRSRLDATYMTPPSRCSRSFWSALLTIHPSPNETGDSHPSIPAPTLMSQIGSSLAQWTAPSLPSFRLPGSCHCESSNGLDGKSKGAGRAYSWPQKS
jgi:hypothetical protein